MDHSAHCDTTNYGEINYSVFSCDQGEDIGSIFFEGMCVDAWGKNLEKNDLAELTALDSWQSLKAGCVLTSTDHSIAMLYENNGLCYYYESTTPYGPPRLRVEACNNLYAGFPRRWCPAQPLEFSLSSPER